MLNAEWKAKICDFGSALPSGTLLQMDNTSFVLRCSKLGSRCVHSSPQSNALPRMLARSGELGHACAGCVLIWRAELGGVYAKGALRRNGASGRQASRAAW